VEVNLELVEGVPPGAVASNVTKAVRYVVQRDLGRTIDELVVMEAGRPLPAIASSAAEAGTARRTGPRKR